MHACMEIHGHSLEGLDNVGLARRAVLDVIESFFQQIEQKLDKLASHGLAQKWDMMSQ